MMQAAPREQLHRLLGGFPPTEFAVKSRTRIAMSGVRAEQLHLQTSMGESTRAFITGPAGEWRGLPAILYIHAHGNSYDIGADELLTGRPALLAPYYAQTLAANNMIALCIDLPCFGTRAAHTESALAKYHLWRGQTLFGAMLADLIGTLNIMVAMPEIDSERIGVFGISMGATLAFWLGALDARIRAAAHLCCFADLATLAEIGAHDLHGIYMTVPGLLKTFRTGQIAGLMAPRPQLVCIGLTDPLTPEKAAHRGIWDLRTAYMAADAESELSLLLSPHTGHSETEAMREATMAFFRTTLRIPQR